MYLEFVILAQILPMANLPPDIDLDKHNYKDNEVFIFTQRYNAQNGLCRGLTKKLGYITLRGDANEGFYSYGFDKKIRKFCFALPNNHCQTFFSAQLSKNIQPF